MIKFTDYSTNKYKDVSSFNEGISIVTSFNGKKGAINKHGKEVIPTIYEDISIFSELLAAAKNKEGKYGYIDKKGNIIIPFIYDSAFDFENGFAIVRNKDGLIYINKEGKKVSNKVNLKINHDNEKYFVCNNTKGNIRIYDNKGILVKELDDKISSVNLSNQNLYSYKDINGNIGLLDKNFNVLFAPIFKKVYGYNDGAYKVLLNDGLEGFAFLDGSLITLDNKKYLYSTLYSEDLACVEDQNGLYGFIDKKGKLVIPCKYKEPAIFKEGVAKVYDENNNLKFIDKNGKTYIDFSMPYNSILETEDETITITESSKLKLEEEKRRILEIKKKDIIKKYNDELSTIESKIYEYSKKSKKY